MHDLGSTTGDFGGEIFPPTQLGWIQSQMLRGEAGIAEVRAHVMEVYYAPLQKYFSATTFRGLGDSEDLVAGFFASRLPNHDYIERWIASKMPLRKWLVNGFLFYLRETARDRSRFKRAIGDSRVTAEPSREDVFEVEWAKMIVRLAADRARQDCNRRGLVENWRLFEEHHLNGRPFTTLATELGIPPRRAAEQSRTAARHMRRAMLEVLERDGVIDGEIESEISRIRMLVRF
ncbi:MAG: hypothetical protein GY910_12345 [bacterium]|nr:hypothetical protein [bacterium]